MNIHKDMKIPDDICKTSNKLFVVVNPKYAS